MAEIVAEKEEVQVKRLAVSAPFHSPQMAKASEIMKKKSSVWSLKHQKSLWFLM